MADPRPSRWLVVAGSLIVLAGVAHGLIINRQREVDEWFLGVLAVILALVAAGVVMKGRALHHATVLSLLLISFSAIIGISPTDWTYSEGAPERFPGLVVISGWYALFLLSPFLLLHFSLIFPIPNRWIERNPRRLVLVYVPYAALLVPLGWQVAFDVGISEWLDDALLLIFPGGFALGLSIFVYQYLVALSTAEKNRLRVVLIGCLAGGVPYVLVLAGRTLGLGSPSVWEYLAYLLVPLFPLSLAFAVLHDNFYDLGHRFQQILLGLLVTAGAISVFYLAFYILRSYASSAAGPGSRELLIAVLLAALAVWPIRRWAWSYAPSLFYRTPARLTPRTAMREFVPIQPNPYIVGNPVRSPEMFFGRKADLQFLRSKLLGQSEGCVILLHGERRVGKTSILHQVANGRLGSGFLPVFVDMQGVVVESDSELLQALAAAVLGSTLGHQPPPHAPQAAACGGYLDFTSFMEDALSMAGGRQLILLIDEYELIEHKVRRGKISAEIFDYLTSLLERFPKQLSLIMTGSRSLEAHHVWHNLVGKSIPRKISFLSPQDATDLICTPLRDRVTFSSEAVLDLLRLTRGQPFFTQLLCQATVEMLNEQRTNHVDRNMVAQVTERVVENPPPQLLYLWNGFSQSEKLLLAAVAGILKTPGSCASSDGASRSIQSLPREHRQGLDAARVRMLLEGLRQRDVLDRDQTRYRFTMDLMRRWIRFEQTVWAVLQQAHVQSQAAGEGEIREQ